MGILEDAEPAVWTLRISITSSVVVSTVDEQTGFDHESGQAFLSSPRSRLASRFSFTLRISAGTERGQPWRDEAPVDDDLRTTW